MKHEKSRREERKGFKAKASALECSMIERVLNQKLYGDLKKSNGRYQRQTDKEAHQVIKTARRSDPRRNSHQVGSCRGAEQLHTSEFEDEFY